MNNFPRKSSIAKHLSPITIVSNAPKTDFNLLKLEIGEHVEVHEENICQINSQNTRGVPAITLNRLRTSTRSYNFLSLTTGKTLTRIALAPLPMPFWVIDCVNNIGSTQNQFWLEVGKSFFCLLTCDEPPDMPTCAHGDGQDLSYDDDDFSHAIETNLDGTAQ